MDGEHPHDPRECGGCRLWRPILEDERGPIGPCRLGVRPGDFPGTAPACERYLSRDEAVPAAPPIRERRRGPGPVPPAVRRRELPPLPEELTAMTKEEFAQAIREVLREEATDVRLSPRWEGGTVVLRPGDPAAQPKEVPIDALLHKIVLIRDRLRVLEQKVNAHPKLSNAEKVEMQQYVTRCYGSLTTFNLLFRDEGDRFVGEKGEKG